MTGFLRLAVVAAACSALGTWLCASAAADAPDPATLLAKHRAFVGWQLGDGAFRSLRLTGTLFDEQGKPTRLRTEWRLGLIYRKRSAFAEHPGDAEDEGFTGNLFWNSNVNGFTTPAYGDLAKYRLSYDLLANEGTASLQAQPRGQATVDGTPCETLRLTVPDGDPIDVDVNESTGAYVRATVDPGGAYERVVHILGYQEVLPGKRMVSAFRLGDSTETFRYSAIEPNAPVSESDLHPPPQRAAWAFAQSAPFAVTVSPTRVIVNASVNGVKGRFILDTGANGIFLNERFADEAKLPKAGPSGAVLGLHGGLVADLRKADSLQIGGNTLSNVIVEAEDFTSNDPFGLDRSNYDGLLGYDIFAGAIVRLDFAAATMSIAGPDEDLPEPGGVAFPVDTSLGVPTVSMTLNRSIDVRAMLDTGDPAGVVFGPDILYRYHLRMARNIGVSLQYGSIECGNLDTLQLGPITYAGEQACKLDSPLVAGKNVLVGLDFLRNFALLFDYPHGRIFFQKARR